MRRIILSLCIPMAIVMGACSQLEIENTDTEDTGSTTSLTDPGLAWSASSFEATVGADNDFPTLTNTHEVSVSYKSSDTSVATIDSDGIITLLAAGTTAISASSSATSTYSASSASYALTVLKAEDGISWSSSTCTVTFGDESSYSFPTLSNPGSQSITYTSSNEYVATIDGDGSVTIVAEGEAVITAAAEANGAYEASSASYTLTVEGTHESAGLSWSVESYTATLASDDNVFPTLANPNNLTVNYSTTDSSIASVDSSTGEITLLATGSVSVIATSAADDTYAAGSAAYTLKVVKHDTALEWSESSFSVVLEEGSSSYPTLSVTPSAIEGDITYTSSKSDVATVDASGNITPLKAGSTVITAAYAGSEVYKSSSASYTLRVTSSVDDGAFSDSFPAAGSDSADDDDISNTAFTRLVSVEYTSAGATVSGYSAVSDVMDVSISGNQVTITYSGTENVVYKLSGTASDGFFKLYSSKKQALWLSGLNLTSTSGAAINNQSGKRTFVYVEGSNYLYDSSSAGYATTGTEDMKAVFFSEGQLIFSGSGTLTVEAKNAKEKSCIASDDYVRIMKSPTLKLSSNNTSAGHGIRGKEYVQLTNGTTEISSKASKKKGITSENYVLVEGGTHNITITGSAGYDSEDGEYKGTAGIKADNYFAMTGGNVTIKNSGTGGKGIRAGSEDYNETGVIDDSYISGGTLNITTTGSKYTTGDVSSKGIKIGWAEGTENRVTANDGSLTISGGTITVSSSNSEAIESKDAFTMTGGELYATSTGDDAVNCVGEMNITGGYIYAYSSKNDALDSNGNFTLSGGYVFAVSTAGGAEVAIDCAEQKTLTIASGVTMVAYPSIESGAKMNQTCYTMSCTAGSWNALYNGSSYIAAFKVPSGISSVVVSAPSLKSGYKGVSVSGTTYCNGIWATSGISGGSSVSLGNYSGGNTGGGPGHGGGPGGPGGGWGW